MMVTVEEWKALYHHHYRHDERSCLILAHSYLYKCCLYYHLFGIVLKLLCSLRLSRRCGIECAYNGVDELNPPTRSEKDEQEQFDVKITGLTWSASISKIYADYCSFSLFDNQKCLVDTGVDWWLWYDAHPAMISAMHIYCAVSLPNCFELYNPQHRQFGKVGRNDGDRLWARKRVFLQF